MTDEPKRYKVEMQDSNGKIRSSYGETFQTQDDLSHSVLDVIIDHLPSGWKIIITVVGLVLIFILFGGIP